MCIKYHTQIHNGQTNTFLQSKVEHFAYDIIEHIFLQAYLFYKHIRSYSYC